jgi:hypothetical protein
VTTVNIVKFDASQHHGTALIARDDSVWVAVCLRWWDIASILFWWLAPSDRKAWATLTNVHGEKVRARVIRIARNHVHIRNAPVPDTQDD